MTHPVQRIIDTAVATLLGGGMFAVGRFLIHDPLGLALWCAAAVICLLPVSLVLGIATVQDDEVPTRVRQERLSVLAYFGATAPIVIGTGLITSWMTGGILFAIALSLIGGAAFLTVLRIPATYAIAFTILGASLSFTWPIWSAGLLAMHDPGMWLQRIVDLSPAFVLNAAVSPEDALTHRPIAYRLVNLGQDVSYAMPATPWPCIALHSGVGLLGLLAGSFRIQPRASTRLPE